MQGNADTVKIHEFLISNSAWNIEMLILVLNRYPRDKSRSLAHGTLVRKWTLIFIAEQSQGWSSYNITPKLLKCFLIPSDQRHEHASREPNNASHDLRRRPSIPPL